MKFYVSYREYCSAGGDSDGQLTSSVTSIVLTFLLPSRVAPHIVRDQMPTLLVVHFVRQEPDNNNM